MCRGHPTTADLSSPQSRHRVWVGRRSAARMSLAGTRSRPEGESDDDPHARVGPRRMFWQPADGFVGDVIPFFSGSEFHAFYLKAPLAPVRYRPEGTRTLWAH